MSEERVDCERIAEVLLEPGDREIPDGWQGHLETCASCREQVVGHQCLIVALSDEELPELSSSFDAGLERKLAAARVEIRPLRGWRKAAMIAYVAVATGIAGGVLRNVPVPTIDLSAQWVPVAVFVAVPLTFLLAIAASKWLPVPRAKLGPLALGL
jgi:hypothetical protein